jgi:hypothetical protein
MRDAGATSSQSPTANWPRLDRYSPIRMAARREGVKRPDTATSRVPSAPVLTSKSKGNQMR